MILEAKKTKSVTAAIFFPFLFARSDGTRCHDLNFFNVEFQASFFTPLLPSSRGFLVPLRFQPVMGTAATELGNLNTLGIIGSQDASGQVAALNC